MIVGLGKTGVSCARYFHRHGIPFAVMDQSAAPSGLGELREFAPDATVSPITLAGLLAAEEIVLSPGVPVASAPIQAAVAGGVRLTGDIAMFGELANAPIVAITGSNGKSTVTALVGALARACGIRAGVGGNIGIPSLDLLAHDCELYVLEVSSYQLELATQLPTRTAVVLNLSPDHLDRYPNAETYYQTKASVYKHCDVAVVPRVTPFEFDTSAARRTLTFGQDEPQSSLDFGLRVVKGETWLANGEANVLRVSELPIRGGHNHVNALAALAIGAALDWEISDMVSGLKSFTGLPHRCEVVATIDGVEYINDSKATNVASTLAALSGLSSAGRNIHLILGGQGKGADFSSLREPITACVKAVHLIGADQALIDEQLAGAAPTYRYATLNDSLDGIRRQVRRGDVVLLSPACASLDQFKNYEDRGEQFKGLVREGRVSS